VECGQYLAYFCPTKLYIFNITCKLTTAQYGKNRALIDAIPMDAIQINTIPTKSCNWKQDNIKAELLTVRGLSQ